MRVSGLLVVVVVLAAGCGGAEGGGDPESGGEPGGGGVALSVAFEPDPPAAGEPVTWLLRVRNGGGESVTLTFPSGKRGDVVLRDDSGQQVYRWSDGRFFTEAVGRQELRPGQEVEYRLDEPSLAVGPGDYALEATLAAEPRVGPDRQQVQIR